MKKKRWPCPCCGYLTGTQPIDFDESCPVCHWEFNELLFFDQNDPGSPNHVSLRTARRNFKEFGAISQESLIFWGKANTPKPEHLSKVRWFWLFWMTYFPKMYFYFRLLEIRLSGKWGKPY